MPFAHAHFFALVHRLSGNEVGKPLQAPSAASFAYFIAPDTQIDALFNEWFGRHLRKVALQLAEITRIPFIALYGLGLGFGLLTPLYLRHADAPLDG